MDNDDEVKLGVFQEKTIKTVDMVIDLQYGSTGKGLLSGWLAHHKGHDTIMTAWGPNAGHTNVDYAGRKYIHTMLANGVIGPRVRRVMVGPGSILNLDNLLAELTSCQDILDARQITIYIHGHAAVVTQEDRDEEERTMTAIGSTKKGVGAAVINKIKRDPNRRSVASQHADHPIFSHGSVALIRQPEEWAAIFDMSLKTLIEGAQGFGLSMNHGFYPYTTSRDVTPAQILADVGIPFVAGRRARVFGTCRTYPIRVANRFDDAGKQVGWSGPHYDDQIELDWRRDLNMEAELTTVTKLPRRIFSYSHQQIAFATEMCDPAAIFLNFVNYLRRYQDYLRIYESLHSLGLYDVMYGIGPTMHDILHSLNSGPEDDWEMIQKAVEARK